MKITFYVLTNDFIDTNAHSINIDKNSSNANEKLNRLTSTDNFSSLLAFVCELTQTVLSKTDKKLLIIDDNVARMRALDEQLWTFSHTSFIAHDLCLSEQSIDNSINIVDSKAPVIIANTITNDFAMDFDGVVLNLASTPITIASIPDAHITANNESICSLTFSALNRLLEIIPSDEENKEKGREKYAHYKTQGHELITHKINKY